MGGDEHRHQLFETARHRAGCTITDLWVDYLALGGRLDLFTLEAYLHGLALLPEAQQDILANAINERLEDLYQAAKVPYLCIVEDQDGSQADPVELLGELLRRGPPGGDGLVG